jgi:hypothetical protein
MTNNSRANKPTRRGILAYAATIGAAAFAGRLASGRQANAANGDTIMVGGAFTATSITEIGGNFNGQVWSIYNESDAGNAVGLVSTLAAQYPTDFEIEPSAIFAKSGAASPAGAAIRAVNVGGGDGVSGYAEVPQKSGVYGANPLGGFGVFGDAKGMNAGVHGRNTVGAGVRGESSGDAAAVHGLNTGTGAGVMGEAKSSDAAVFGRNTGVGDGVVGSTPASDKSGVYGENSGGGYGVYGYAGGSRAAVTGRNDGAGPGVHAFSKLGVGLTVGSEGSAGIMAYGASSVSAIVGSSTGAGAGVQGGSSAGDGVRGASNGAGAAGVRGTNSGGGDGVAGLATGANGAGVRAESTAGGHGLAAVANGNKGAVLGRNSAAGDGVTGRSRNGRGGSFAGKAAALRLIPSTATDHPANGRTGDLFLDRTRRLWFCKRGGAKATWFQLA